MADIEALIDEDVDWAIYGPIDMFPFLGARRGKAAVMEVIRQVAENVRVHRFDRESIMLGVDSASSMLRYSLTALDSNKPISLRLAHFAQFRAGRLISIRVLVDTFDLVEQAVGLSHPFAAGWRSGVFRRLTRALRHARAKAASASSRHDVPAMTDTLADNVGVARHNFATRESAPLAILEYGRQ